MDRAGRRPSHGNRVAPAFLICKSDHEQTVSLRQPADGTAVAVGERQMRSESGDDRNTTAGAEIRNPFGVMDVPDPNDQEVMQFADTATLEGSSDDENAATWVTPDGTSQHDTVEGNWSSRWNGGADPTIAGDAADKWKQGHAEARILGERLYLRFDWDNGARQGLIDARREGPQRLVGKYINLSNPSITRPWIGQIIGDRRIDGRWTQGRLDFRR
jgi:hypothetical protein